MVRGLLLIVLLSGQLLQAFLGAFKYPMQKSDTTLLYIHL
jgi:hypothetical protein